MPSVFDKLNLKNQSRIVVLNAPQSFEAELGRLKGVAVIRSLEDSGEIEFSLAFVTKQKEVDTLAQAIAKKAKGDAVVWFAYPKGTSKKYTCEINRDTGWGALVRAGFEPVRMVAIDEDWSAKRYRRGEYVKSTSPNRARILASQASRP